MSEAVSESRSQPVHGAELAALASCLESMPALNSHDPSEPGDLGNAVFVGSGDSLAAALLAERFGHRALSAGDIAWSGQIPPRCDTLVGVSQSGNTGATVLALRAARDAGLRTVALTTDGASALVGVADQTRLMPLPQVRETIPAAGYVTLAAGVLALCGRDLSGFGREIGVLLTTFAREHGRRPLPWPDTAPSSISVLTLPDLRSAGDFWMLKLIEATGVAARALAPQAVPRRRCPDGRSAHQDQRVAPGETASEATLSTTVPHGPAAGHHSW